MKLRVAIIALLAACVPCLPASAQSAYMGASYLDSSFNLDTSLQQFDASANGWKIFGGYTGSPNLGVEIAYYDLGNFDDTTATGSFDADIQVYDFAAHGILPLGERFEIFLRLGYSYVDLESFTATGPITARVDAGSWELSYGAGVGLKLGKSFGIRAEYEAWDTEDDLDAFSVGGVFRFGQR